MNRLLSLSGIKITDKSTIKAPLNFYHGNVIIEDNVFINGNCNFLDDEMILVKKNSLIGPNFTLSPPTHNSGIINRNELICKPITINENVWIGAGSVILLGVTTGKNSVIAANSVVSESVPDNCLYAGSPARFKKKLS